MYVLYILLKLVSFSNCKKFFLMISTIAERETFRKRLEKLIPQLEKSKIVEHFEKEGIVRSTIYANIKRLENGYSFREGMSPGRPSIFTARNWTNLIKYVLTESTALRQKI